MQNDVRLAILPNYLPFELVDVVPALFHVYLEIALGVVNRGITGDAEEGDRSIVPSPRQIDERLRDLKQVQRDHGFPGTRFERAEGAAARGRRSDLHGRLGGGRR